MACCYLCGVILNANNNSVEHILPNSIGGKLKSNELICKECNEFCGTNIDNVLSEAGNIFASKYNIKRDRGKIPNLKAFRKDTEERVTVSPGWITRQTEPTITKENNSIIIATGTRKRLLQEIKKYRIESERKGIPIEISEPKRIIENNKDEIVFNICIDKEKFLRSAAKVIASFYYFKTKDFNSVKTIGNYIRNETNNDYVWFFDMNLDKKLLDKKYNHIIYFKGSKNENMLYGYFEMFGFFGFVCILNRQYQGDNIEHTYIYNSIEGKEKKVTLEFKFKKETIISLIDMKPDKFEFKQ